MSENPNTTLPKWPFLTGDAVLVLLACYIVIASPKPMATISIFACALSVILGMLVYVTPYIIEHLTQQQRVKLKQAKAGETLLKAAEVSADLLNRTEMIHAELMKGVLNVKQVPAKLDEKTEEILQILDSDKLTSTVADLEDLLNRLESIPGGLGQSQDISGIAELPNQLEKYMTQFKNQLGATSDSIESDIEALRNEILERISQIEVHVPSLSENSNLAAEETDSIEDPDVIEKEENETHNNDNGASVEHAENEDPEDESIEIESSESIEAEESEVILDHEISAGVDIKQNEDGATRLLVGAFIGISNKLFIRGEGPGLEWDRGVPMELVGIGKWEWKTYDAHNVVRCKVLINDEQSNDSENIEIEPNTTVETTASF